MKRHHSPMIPLEAIGRSMRRSHARRKVLVALDVLGRGTIAQLAEQARIDVDRVEPVLHGDGKGFRRDLALVTLGLVEKEGAGDGGLYAITARGRLIVKSLERGGLRLLVDGPAAAARDAAVAAREAAQIAARGNVCPHCGRGPADAGEASGAATG